MHHAAARTRNTTAHAARMTRAIGLAALTVLELPPPDMVTCAAEAGFTHIGLRLIPATPTEVSYATIGDTPIIRATLERLADTGIEVLDIEILRLTPDADPRDFLPVLETGARLGARNALIAGNDPDEGRLTERFAALCELAAPLRHRALPGTDAVDRRAQLRAGRARAAQRRACQCRPAGRRDPLRPGRQSCQRDRRGAARLAALCPAVRRAGGAPHRARRAPAAGSRGPAAAGRRRPRPRRHPARAAAADAAVARNRRRRRWRERCRRSSGHGARWRPRTRCSTGSACRPAERRPSRGRRMAGSPSTPPP